MEEKIENQPEKKEQKFNEKYGMWIIVIGSIVSIFIIRFLLDLLQK